MSDRSKIAVKVSKAVGVSKRDADNIVNEVIKQLAEGLVRDGRIELRDIGVWRTKFRPKSIRTIQFWKKKAVYGGMVKIYFKAGKWLRAAVNEGRDYDWSAKKQIRGSKNDGGQYKIPQQERSEEVSRAKTTPEKWGDSRS